MAKQKVAGNKGAGPPKVFVRRHIIELHPNAIAALDDLQETFIKGKVARAAGEAVKGILGHPAGLALLITLSIWGLGRLGLWKAVFPGATGAVEAMGGFLGDFQAETITATSSGIADIGMITMGAFTKFIGRVLETVKIPV